MCCDCWPFSLCKRDVIWKECLLAKKPIFWILGPPHSGKTTLAHFLADAINYRLVHVRYLANTTNQKRRKNYVKLIKKELKETFIFSPGYILEDFPINMKECKNFEKKIGQPTIIFYIASTLDGTIGRVLAQRPAVDINAVRVQYVKHTRFAEKIYRRYRKSRKVVKIFSQYPISETHLRALEILETEYSYKIEIQAFKFK